MSARSNVEMTGDVRITDNDEIDETNSDENEGPAGERWAPVGANDGDNDFEDEYKYSNSMERCAQQSSEYLNLRPHLTI